MAPTFRRRAGYTLIELTVVLALGGVLLLAAFGFAAHAYRAYVAQRQRFDVEAASEQAHGRMARDLERVGRGVAVAPNGVALHVSVAGDDASAADTLLVVWAEDEPPLRGSIYGCRDASPACVLVVGTAEGLEAGDMVALGNARTGMRLYQVDAVEEGFDADCGGDCEEEIDCAESGATTAQVPTVSISYVVTPMGSDGSGNPINDTTFVEGPCPASYYDNGASCHEQVDFVAVGLPSITTCSAQAGAVQGYTEVRLVDRTAQLGFPELSTFTLTAGARGVPPVRIQEVRLARYLLEADGAGRHTLLRQPGLTQDGGWRDGYPVARNVVRMRAETQHRGESGYRRGLGYTGADLLLSGANANLARISSPAPGASGPAWRFLRSQTTIASVRVTLAIQEPESALEHTRPGRTVESVSVADVRSLLEGGSAIP